MYLYKNFIYLSMLINVSHQFVKNHIGVVIGNLLYSWVVYCGFELQSYKIRAYKSYYKIAELRIKGKIL